MRVRNLGFFSPSPQCTSISEEELISQIESVKEKAGKAQRFYIFTTLGIWEWAQAACGFHGDQIGFCYARARSYRAHKAMIRAREKFTRQFTWLQCLLALQKRMKLEEEN